MGSYYLMILHITLSNATWFRFIAYTQYLCYTILCRTNVPYQGIEVSFIEILHSIWNIIYKLILTIVKRGKMMYNETNCKCSSNFIGGGKIMTYKAIDVAKALLYYADKKELPITNLHLQKMLYYAQGFSYAITGHELFSDDIYAWKYGPVVPDVYRHYKSFVSAPISEKSNIDDIKIDNISSIIIKKVSETIGSLDPWYLVEKTHQEAPWKKNYGNSMDIVIPKKDIKTYFEGMKNDG